MYVNCKTYFSLRYGTFATEELVKAAVENGVHTLALTNINTTWSLWALVGIWDSRTSAEHYGNYVRKAEMWAAELGCRSASATR